MAITKAYDVTFREKVINNVLSGGAIEEIAKVLKISVSSIYSWMRLKKKTGSVAPKKDYRKGHGAKIIDLEKFKEFVLENQDCSAGEMAKKWGNISAKTILKYLKKIGFTQKKSHFYTMNKMQKRVQNIWKQSKI